MSSVQVESILVRFLGDASSYTNAGKQVTGVMDKVLNRAAAVGSAMTMKVTLPIVTMQAASVKAYSAFNGAMTQSLSIMGDISPAMEKALGKQAVDLSLRAATSATKLAESYYFLSSAGLNAEQSLGALPLVQTFATAGMFDMARATDLLTDAQSALGLFTGDTSNKMKEMGHVSDVLVKANTLANASVEQFSIALTSKAATSMRAYGVEIEEGVSVLAAYADQGIKAELAGNAYDRVLRLLSKSARDNADTHKKFGLEVFNAEGEMNSMSVIAKQLEVGMSGMSTEQKSATLEMLGFEARIQQAIFPLIGMSDAMARYKRELMDAGGITEEVANKQLKSFMNQMAITANHVIAVAISIGRILAPSVLAIGEVIRGASRAWLSFDDRTKIFIVRASQVLAAVGPLLLSLTLIGPAARLSSMGLAMTASMAARAAFAFRAARLAAMSFIRTVVGATLMNPVFLAVAGTVALIGLGIVGLIRLIGGPGSLSAAWAWVGEKITAIKDMTLGFFANFQENMGILWDAIVVNWGNIGTIIGTFVSASINNFGVLVTTGFKLWSAFMGWLSVQVPQIAYEVSMKFAAFVTQGFADIIAASAQMVLSLTTIFISFGTGFMKIWGDIKKFGMQAMMDLVMVTIKIIEDLKSGRILQAFTTASVAVASTVSDGIQKGMQAGAYMTVGAVTKAAQAYAGIKSSFDENFTAGASNRDFMKTAGTILGEGASRLQNPLADMTMPEFNLDRKKADEVKEVVSEANSDLDLILGLNANPAMDAVNNFKDTVESTPVTMTIDTGVQAMSANSADAFALVRGQMESARRKLDAAGFSPRKGQEHGAAQMRGATLPFADELATKLTGNAGAGRALGGQLRTADRKLGTRYNRQTEAAEKARLLAATRAGEFLTPIAAPVTSVAAGGLTVGPPPEMLAERFLKPDPLSIPTISAGGMTVGGAANPMAPIKVEPVEPVTSPAKKAEMLAMTEAVKKGTAPPPNGKQTEDQYRKQVLMSIKQIVANTKPSPDDGVIIRAADLARG